MICPNKSTQYWKDLVAKYGEELALVKFNANIGNTEVQADISEAIRTQVMADPQYYRNKYADFLSVVDNPTSEQMVGLFTARLDYPGAKLEGDLVNIQGQKYSLFPETSNDTNLAGFAELPKEERDQLLDAMAFKLKAKPSKKDFLESIHANQQRLSTSDESDFYQDADGNNVAKRLTTFVSEFSTKFKNKTMSMAEYAARMLFKQQGVTLGNQSVDEITATIKLGGIEYTFKEVLAAKEKELSQARIVGKMTHSFIQFLLETNTTKRAQAKAAAIGYASSLGLPFYSLETHKFLAPITQNFQNILDKAGIIIDLEGTKGIPKNKQDKAAAEVILSSEILQDASGNKLATTADGLFQHYNGEVTLLDWKTGNIASDHNTRFLLAYGDKYGISDSKISRASLELVLRAIMLKEKEPQMKFRSVKIVKINHLGQSQNIEVDLQPYLYTIGDYYKEVSPEIYTKLQELGLLEASSYKGVAASSFDIEARTAGLTAKEKRLYLQTKLAGLHAGRTRSEIESDPNIRQLSKVYSDAILEMEKDPVTDFTSQTEDLGSFWRFKNFSDVANPKVQTIHKMLLEGKYKTRQYLLDMEAKHDELYEKLANARKGTKIDWALGAVNIYSIVTFNPFLFVGSILAHKYLSRQVNETTQDHFAFMWRRSDDPYRPGYFLNTLDTYEHKGQEIALTKEQRDYREFVYTTMKREYNNFANQVVGYRGETDIPIFQHQKLGLPATLPEDFLPRIPKSIEEIREEEKFSDNWFGIKTVVGNEVKRKLTAFLEDSYENEDGSIPLKYFKHDNSTVVGEVNHSWNVEQSFKYFMASLKAKQNLDPLYDITMATASALKEETDPAGNKRYPNLTEWLDSQITMQILNKQDSVKLTTKGVTLKANALTEKLTGIPQGTPMVVSQNNILRMLKSLVTHSVMSFKVWAPIRNALMIAAANTTQATRKFVNTQVGTILGVPPESFENINLSGGRVSIQQYLTKKFTGKENESKLWKIAQKFDWLPDNFPYEVNNDRLLSKSIQVNVNSHAYLFYELGENLGALWQLAGLMQSIKVVNASGKESTLWDAYDDQGNWILGTRGVEETTTGNKEISELTALEIKTLKRAYEKLNGSYRKEEKTAIEATVLGDFVMQFHKYFYQYLKVLFASPYKDITVGRYVMTGKRPDGMPVYQWHSEVMEGQIRVLVGSVFAAMSGKTKEYLLESNFGENTLRGHRARTLAASLNTFAWFMGLLLVFSMSLDDDEEKSYLGRSIHRTILDLSRGLSPSDLIDTAKKPVVAIDKLTQLALAFGDLAKSSVTGERDRKGNLKGATTVGRALPGLGGAMQMQDLLNNTPNDKYLFGIIPIEP